MRLALAVLLLWNTAAHLKAQTLLHYWNFNSLPSGTLTSVASDYSLVSAGSITYPGTGSGYMDNVNPGSALNARNGDAVGLGIRPRNPSDTREFLIAAPTSGWEGIIIKFATTRTTQGASEQYYSYSIDGGSTYSDSGLSIKTFNPPAEPNYDIVTIDFTGIKSVNDKANFVFRIRFGGTTAGGSSGNNRFDNITVEANSTKGSDLFPPTVTFNPSSGSTGVDVNVKPTLTFNEDVRLINNAPIDAGALQNIVEFKLNDVNGSNVPFTGAFSNKVITITPSQTLLPKQKYYIALKANTVEDLSDNAIDSVKSASFTTLAQQTQFKAGDMVIVAYRMNATSTEDEIAILPFVDILPETRVNITDSKVTGPTPLVQCAGGLVWTSPENECIPAGTIITIQTSAGVVNKGTLSGGTFGLSSGGDQVIIYTGTAANPNYITALTSINWVNSNSSCGGGVSLIPPGLTDGTNALNTSSSPGNAGGLSINGYYKGTQNGTPAQLRSEILNPANWEISGSGTAPQTWPSWNFPSSPGVTNVSVAGQNTIRVIFNRAMDPVSAQNTANYTGISGLNSAVMTQNGNLADTVILTYANNFTSGGTYSVTVANVLDANGTAISCPITLTFTYNTEVSWAKNFVATSENAGTLNLDLNVLNPGDASVEVIVLTGVWSTARNNLDFRLASPYKVNISGSGGNVVKVPVEIINDTEEEQHAEYVTLLLRNPVNCQIKGDTLLSLYIRDDDRKVPTPDKSIELQYIGSFDPSGANNSTCEIVVYDSASRRLFSNSSVANVFDIIDFSNPLAPSVIKTVSMASYGGITSLAVHNGILAVASPNANEQLDGSVVFFDLNGNFKKQVKVGALPDMITFTPDGKKLLAANEGQPNNDYSIDPEGSISIIDMSVGIDNLSQSNVFNLDLKQLNSKEHILIPLGVRKTFKNSTLSQDLEPEYITVSDDSKTAWFVCQENNAIGEINLENNALTDFWPLGVKSVESAQFGFDVSDNNNEILIANWPIKAYLIPDAIANYTFNGKRYLVTANEGDEKEYGGLNERTTVGDPNYRLDSRAFPQAAMLKKSWNLGRMRVTNLNGDTDGDGDFDEIYCVGSRSFTIMEPMFMGRVYDSKDDMERITAADPQTAAIFNASNDNNTLKNRSRAKGPEPEGLTLASISGKTYAFIGLERIGGVMVYDITDPRDVKFVDYKNSRSTSAFTGDHGPEGIIYIAPHASPNGKGYVVVANEISGTLSIYEVKNNNVNTSNGKISAEPLTFNVFPNPVKDGGILYFNRMADVEVYDLNGRMLDARQRCLTLDISSYAAGIYLVRTDDGAAVRFVVEK